VTIKKGLAWKPPGESKRVHPEGLVHAGCVTQEHGQKSFKDKSKVEAPVVNIKMFSFVTDTA